jgi:hypothetical protein
MVRRIRIIRSARPKAFGDVSRWTTVSPRTTVNGIVSFLARWLSWTRDQPSRLVPTAVRSRVCWCSEQVVWFVTWNPLQGLTVIGNRARPLTPRNCVPYDTVQRAQSGETRWTGFQSCEGRSRTERAVTKPSVSCDVSRVTRRPSLVPRPM